MAEFHVLDDFCRREHGSAREPGHLVLACEQRDPAAGGQCPLQLNRAADVAGVPLLAARLLDVGSDRVQFPREFLDVLGGQMCILLDVGNSHVSP